MSRIEEIADRTAAGIALAFRSGEARPSELVECLMARIEAAQADKAFISVSTERALNEARAADARYIEQRPLSPLDGVPFAWKDLFHVAGSRTTAGSALRRDETPSTEDSPFVANAARMGVVSIGKANLTEMAYSGIGLNPHFGTAKNPNGKGRAPGGSSSGSGAAVAGRLVPVAIGSDTGGSVRIPAAFNGVVGFKTSTGRLDTTGIVALAATYDTVGPLARSVEDCVLADMAMRGVLTTPVRRASLAGTTFIAPTNVVLEEAEADVLWNFERTLKLLERAGATVRREPLPVLDEVIAVNAAYGNLTAAEAYVEYRDIVDSDRVAKVDRRVVARILGGKTMSAHDVISIQRSRPKLIAQLAPSLGGAFLAMPTTPIVAPEIAPLEADDDLFHKTNMLALRNTMLGNFLDLCGVAMPNGRDIGGMPTSLLISALHGEDDRLLGVALEVERMIGAW